MTLLRGGGTESQGLIPAIDVAGMEHLAWTLDALHYLLEVWGVVYLSALRVVMVHLFTDYPTMLPDQGGFPSLHHCLLSSLSTSNFELLSEVKVHFLSRGTACFAL